MQRASRFSLFIALVATSGCDRVFGLTDIRDDDPPSDATDVDPGDAMTDAPTCEVGTWTVSLHPELGDLADPSVSEDGRELFANDSDGRLQRATRDDVTMAFDPLSPVSLTSAVPGMLKVYDFNLTADGLSAVMLCEPPVGTRTTCETSRPDLQGAWARVELRTTFAPTGGVDYSADGLTVWASTGDDATTRLLQLTRSTRDRTFTSSDELQVGMGIRWPTVTRDQLTLYHHDGEQKIQAYQRLSPTGSFAAPTPAIFDGLTLLGLDLDLTHNGRFMVIRAPDGAGGHQIAIHERTCEE